MKNKKNTEEIIGGFHTREFEIVDDRRRVQIQQTSQNKRPGVHYYCVGTRYHAPNAIAAMSSWPVDYGRQPSFPQPREGENDAGRPSEHERLVARGAVDQRGSPGVSRTRSANGPHDGGIRLCEEGPPLPPPIVRTDGRT